jgi:hypothetical protein
VKIGGVLKSLGKFYIQPFYPIKRIGFGLVLVLFAEAALYSQKADGPAIKLSNPVGFISVPFQNNFESGIGLNRGFKWTLNLQPILPFSLNRGWNLINRIHLPVIRQDNVLGRTSQTGIGDAVMNGLFSPKKRGII